MARPQIVRRLTLYEIADLLGWRDDGTPEQIRNRTRDRLKRVEAATGVRLVHRGGGPGNPSWVPWSALRDAGLVDDVSHAVGALREERDELAAQVIALRKSLRLLSRRVLDLEHLVAAQQLSERDVRRVRALAAKLRQRQGRPKCRRKASIAAAITTPEAPQIPSAAPAIVAA